MFAKGELASSMQRIRQINVCFLDFSKSKFRGMFAPCILMQVVLTLTKDDLGLSKLYFFSLLSPLMCLLRQTSLDVTCDFESRLLSSLIGKKSEFCIKKTNLKDRLD